MLFCWTVWRWEDRGNSEHDSLISEPAPGLFSSLWKGRETLSVPRDPYLLPSLAILITGQGPPLMRDESPQGRQVAPERRPRRARARWEGPGLTLRAAAGPG